MIRDALLSLWRSPTVRLMGPAIGRWLRATDQPFVPVQLESPFRAHERAHEYLQAAIRDCVSRGETPYASHQMLTQAYDDANALERNLGTAAGFAMRPYTARTVVYVDLGVSLGMQHGIEDAERIGHRIERRQIAGWE